MVDPDRDATGDEAPAAEGPTRVVEAVGAPQAESFEALEGFQRDEETSAPTTPRASAEHRRDAAIGRGVFEDDVDSSDADDAAAGDVALRKVVVVSSEAGVASGDHKDEGKSKVATAEDDEDYCRICMDPVTSDHLARGDATHLGCACVGGYMHRACAVDFVVKKNTAVMLCEVCLEEMVGLEVIAAELREERRAAHRARVTVMTLNGVPPRRRPRRSRRGDGTIDDDDDDYDYEWSDARLDAPGWGSRNPLVWILWILSRPFALAIWLIRFVVTCRFVILLVGFFVLLSYFLFGFRRDGDHSLVRAARNTTRVEWGRIDTG